MEMPVRMREYQARFFLQLGNWLCSFVRLPEKDKPELCYT